MKTPEEIACEIVDDFWDKGTGDHFMEVHEMIEIGKGATRKVKDIEEVERIAEEVRKKYGA